MTIPDAQDVSSYTVASTGQRKFLYCFFKSAPSNNKTGQGSEPRVAFVLINIHTSLSYSQQGPRLHSFIPTNHLFDRYWGCGRPNLLFLSYDFSSGSLLITVCLECFYSYEVLFFFFTVNLHIFCTLLCASKIIPKLMCMANLPNIHIKDDCMVSATNIWMKTITLTLDS